MRSSFKFWQLKSFEKLVVFMLLTFLLLPIYLSAPEAQARQTDADKYYWQAVKFEKQKKYKEAIRYASAAIKLYGRSSAAGRCYKIIYECHKAQKNYVLALKSLDLILKCDPNVKGPYIERANIHFLQKKPELAEQDLKKALTLFTPKDNAYFVIGCTYDTNNLLDKAAASYRKALELNPKNPNAAINLSFVLEKQEKYDEQLEVLTKALKFDPTNFRFLNLRSNCYKDMGNYNRAVADITKTLEKDPNNYLNRYCRVQIYEKSGQIDKAIEDMKTYLALRPVEHGWAKLFDLYLSRAKYDEAFAMLSDKRIPEKTRLNLKINYWNNRRQPDKAIAAINEAIKLYPKDHDYIRIKAIQLANKADYKNALAEIDKFLALEPKSNYGKIVKGSILARSNKIREAEEVFKSILKNDPKYLDGYNYLVLLHLDNRQPEKAVDVCNQRIKALSDAGSYFCRAKLLHSLGRDEEAKADYKKIIELDPKNYIRPLRYAKFLHDTGGSKEEILKYLELGKTKAKSTTGHLEMVAHSYHWCDRNEDAITIADKALTKFNNSSFLKVKALALWAMGKHEDAINTEKECCEQVPFNDQHYYTLGWMSEVTGDVELAINAFGVSHKMDPEDCQTFNALAFNNLVAGNREEAQKLLEESINRIKFNLNANLPDSYDYTRLANAYGMLGKFEEAEKYANKALVMNPNKAFALNCLAIAEEGLGKTDKALATISKAISLDKDNGGFLERRAIILNILGKKDQAKKDWAKAQEFGINLDFWKSKPEILSLKPDDSGSSE